MKPGLEPGFFILGGGGEHEVWEPVGRRCGFSGDSFSVMPDLIRHPVDARLRGEESLSAQGLGLAGYRLKAGMTEVGMPPKRQSRPIRYV